MLVWVILQCTPPPFFQMADIPLDENLASILVAAQYVLGYWSVQRVINRDTPSSRNSSQRRFINCFPQHRKHNFLASSDLSPSPSLSSVFVTRIPRRTLLFASLTIMTLANLSAGIVLLYRDKPTPLLFNSSQPIVEADFGLGDGTAPLLLPSPASVPDPSLLDVPDPSLLPLQEHSDLEHAIRLGKTS